MLYIVPTPIGNLQDITLRAIKTLESAETVLCEDPRVTRKLYNLLELQNKPRFVQLERDHNFNNNEIKATLNENLVDNKIIALVSDAGTPGISDPAFEVLQIVLEIGLSYTTLPGATAVIPAIVNSNLVSKEFLFLGFLPIKKGRQTEWKRISNSSTPVVIYESCHRIAKFIEECQQFLVPATKICINQEISKSHENIWIGTIDDIKKYPFVAKGEFVIVIRN